MSQRAKRRRTVAEPEFFSQPATFVEPNSRSRRTIDDDELEELINKCTQRAVGVMMNQKTLHPFSTSEIVSGMPVSRKYTSAIVKRAKELLFECYGLKAVEVEAGKHIVCLPRDARIREFIDDNDKKPLKTFLAVTLSFICFHKGMLKQETLLNRYFPKFFPETIVDGRDEYFGKISDLLKELKASMYLEEMSKDNDVILKIGPRSKEEFCIKELVLPYLNMMLSRIPEDLKQYLESLPA